MNPDLLSALSGILGNTAPAPMEPLPSMPLSFDMPAPEGMSPGLPTPPPSTPSAGKRGAFDVIRELMPMIMSAAVGLKDPVKGAALAHGQAQGMLAAQREHQAEQERQSERSQQALHFEQQTAQAVMSLKDPILRQRYLQYAHDIGVEHFGLPQGWTAKVPAGDAKDDALSALKGELAAKLKAFDADKKWATVAGTAQEGKISFQLSNGQSVPVSMARRLVGQAVFDAQGQQAFAPPADMKPEKKAYQQKEVVVNGKRVLANFDPATGKMSDDQGVAVTGARPAPSKAAGGSGGSVANVAGLKEGTPAFKVAQDLAYGKMTFSQFRTIVAYNRDASAKMALYAKASELNPDFNPAKFEMGYKFAANPATQRALAAVDNVLPNIDRIIELSDSWDRTKYPDVNRFLGAMQFKMGNRTVANIKQAQKLIGDELGVALGAGAMTDMKLKLGLDVVDPSLPADVFLSNMERVKEFLRNRKLSLLKQAGIYGTEDMNPGGAVEPPKAETPKGAPLTIGRFKVQVGGGN